MARWTRNELLLALDLYFRTPFGKQHSRHQPIIELANRLDRTPSAVAMKLNNLTSLDPAERARGIQGLGNASRLDSQIWEEYTQNPGEIALEIENLIQPRVEITEVEELQTETEAVRRIRLQQNFFRRVVLNTYESRCCISGLPVPELLRASHIVPWSRSEKDRLNPRNGLCLAATFDAAFDRGLIWFDDEFRLRLTSRLVEFESDSETKDLFIRRDGLRLRLPEKNLPDRELLGWHRENIAQLN